MDGLHDDELVYLTRQGSEEAFELLNRRYQRLIHYLIHAYAASQAGMEDYDDIHQILWITFHKQKDAYREDRNMAFSSFMYMVLKRRLTSLMRDRHSKKEMAMKRMVSLDDVVGHDPNGKGMYVAETVADQSLRYRPADRFYIKESLNAIYHLVDKQATAFEKEVFSLSQKGYSIQEIALLLHCSCKSVSNAVYRIKNKIKVKKS